MTYTDGYVRPNNTREGLDVPVDDEIGAVISSGYVQDENGQWVPAQLSSTETTQLEVRDAVIPSAFGSTGQQDVTLIASRIAFPALAGRRAIRIKNMTSSARGFYYGFNNGVTAANGDEISEGETVEFDADETVEIYVITTSTGGAGVRCSWAEFA